MIYFIYLKPDTEHHKFVAAAVWTERAGQTASEAVPSIQNIYLIYEMFPFKWKHLKKGREREYYSAEAKLSRVWVVSSVEIHRPTSVITLFLHYSIFNNQMLNS